ncbi:MAG TPA: EamA family transporter [Steroidobacteraceae bacterium]|nr:EamA family transporter [Steroidobacteraceae bacterium]
MSTKHSLVDLTAIAVCALAWGTTWYAITLQFGTVDPIVSLVYRFSLAAVLLFAWAALRRQPIRLSRAQHLSAAAVGLFTFAIDYAFTYWAEERVVSAVVAVMFGTLSFVNLIMFRIVRRERAPRTAWMAALLGAGGVALLSWSEVAHAEMNGRAIAGLAFAFVAVVMATVGNLFARRGEEDGAPLIAFTAWSMAYGTVLLAIHALITGRAWNFEPSMAYVVSLLYLAVIGSVVAFLLYFGLARRRGFTTASYIMTLTPLIAMLMSTLFEDKRWSFSGIGGVALILFGQWLLLRAKVAAEHAGSPRAAVLTGE